MVQTRRAKLLEEASPPKDGHAAPVPTPRSSDSTISAFSLTSNDEREAHGNDNSPLAHKSSGAAEGARLRSLSDSGLSSVPMSEDESPNDPTPEATEMDGEDVASQHHDSPSAATRAAQARGLFLRAPSESGLSSDPTYEDDEDDEDEFQEGLVSDDDDNATISEDSYHEVRRQVKAEKAVPERHPDAPSVSKLQKRIAEAKANGIDLDENGVRKGHVRDTANGLEYLKAEQWIPACYHTDLRKRLLQLTDARGSYLRDPTKGWDELDRTSFKEDQKDWWFEDRDRRPDVLFLWEDPGYYPDYDPEVWYDHGRIVLDTKNHPLKLWRNLPLTISGQCEGYRLETFRRLDTRITMNDLRARMPLQTCKGRDKTSRTIKTPMLANRMSRSRMYFGIKAWDPKQGSAVKQYRMMQTMPEAIQHMILRTNSTRGYRDLTDAEVEYIDLGNKGTAAGLAKAGPRQLADKTRQANQKLKYQRRSKKFASSPITIHNVIREAFPEGLVEPKTKRLRTPASTASPAAPALVYSPMDPMEEDHREDHGEVKFGEQSHHGGAQIPSPGGETAWHPAPGFLPAGPSTENYHASATGPYGSSFNARHINNPTMQPATHGNMEPNIASNNNPSNNNNNNNHPVRSDADLRRLGMARVHGTNLGIDFRYKKPESDRDVAFIQDALQLSRADFQHIIGFGPMTVTDHLQPYAYQLSELQAELNWTYPAGHPPYLRSWGHMTSFENYMGRRQDYDGAGNRGFRGHEFA
ncbi:hypothetical protein XANCAGTX0491_007448 [Xanthoria calcicola]